MLVSLLVAFEALLFIVVPASAQVNAPNCSGSWEWSFNSLVQGPCLVAAYLASVCNNGAFTILDLLPQHSYIGPNGLDNGDLCKCNTVTYNLISACDACQEQLWIPYTQWTANCTVVAAPRTFPEPVPAGTRVPQWAYLDPTSNDSWDLTAAQLAGDSPEVTGSVTIVPTSTRNGQSTVLPRTTSSVSSFSSKSTSIDSSNVGEEVAGIVVCGIFVAALISGIAFLVVVRRRRARSALPVKHHTDGQDTGQLVAPYQRLYNPSDPSTYPPLMPSRMMQTKNYSGQCLGSGPKLKYNGLPEP